MVLYEDAGLKHLKEFVAALEGCRAMAEAVNHFRHVADGLTSTRLKALVTPGVPSGGKGVWVCGCWAAAFVIFYGLGWDGGWESVLLATQPCIPKMNE